jgi:hypothetical protein
MAKKASNTEVAVKASTAVGEVDKELLAMYEQDKGAGLENADKDAYAMPFLIMLQKGSPQVDEDDGAHVEGAKQGMLFNTVTGKFYESVDVIPAHFERRFLRWADRKEGGGFRGEYTADDQIVQDTKADDEGKLIVEGSTDQLKDTRLHYVLVIEKDGSFTPALINLSSTQVKKSRNWCSKMDAQKIADAKGVFFTKPTYSTVYTITSTPESNDKGSWQGWVISIKGPAPVVLYHAAKAFKAAVEGGKAKVDFKTASDGDDVKSGKASERF